MAQCDVAIQVPGPRGTRGANGADGSDGRNAFSTTVDSFTMPAVGDTVDVFVDDSTWASATANAVDGQVVHVQAAGYMFVAGKPDNQTLQLTNLGTDGNISPGTILPTGLRIAPAGLAGSEGAAGVSGAPTTASYWTRTAEAGLSNETNLTALGAGILKINSSGVPSIAVAETDYLTSASALINADIGVAVQAWDAMLDALAALVTVADRMIYFTGANAPALTTLTTFARTLLDDADAAAARSTLGLSALPSFGYTSNTLSTTNVTLTKGSSTDTQRFTGTLAGPVQIILSQTSAVAGTWFWLHLFDVVTSAVNTLDIRDSSLGSLKLYNTANTTNGLIRAYYTGSQWMLGNLEAVELT